MVYRYPLDARIHGASTDIRVPRTAKLLKVGPDIHGGVSAWYEVTDTDNAEDMRVDQIELAWTGHILHHPGTHVDTFNQGSFTWHAYYRTHVPQTAERADGPQG